MSDSQVPEVSAHIRQYLSTSGALGHDYFGFPTLLLTTRGRRSGKLYRTPLIYGRDDDRYVVVASNAAKPRNPDWYENLIAHPDATVQLMADRFPVTARPAQPQERDRLWDLMATIFPQYRQYATETTRPIPVVVLEPAAR
ncbi:nitroreductase family deazaflavin-dependent oxidoreductase [Krasilnikovia sp. MM14-A1004]|uniref:nitroreductase family deazaflavin-dependent oxidoreductase n=1 Tax=Krasilnikovia sp. MM14-A1004 TaxID=3373541 RepID=UPI00399C58AA